MSPSTNSILSAMAAIFSRLPVERLSSTTTSCPFSRIYLVRLQPMKPAPPVTRYFAILSFHMSFVAHSRCFTLRSFSSLLLELYDLLKRLIQSELRFKPDKLSDFGQVRFADEHVIKWPTVSLLI